MVLDANAFVAFVARNPVGSWRERALNTVTQVDGSIATLWFDYTIERGGAIAQCGRNAVQLRKEGGEWKILAMTFTNEPDCSRRPGSSE